MTHKTSVKETAIAAIGDQIKRLLVTHSNKIFEGYQAFGDEDFPISISVKMCGGMEHVNVKTRISFSTEKIKDETEEFINTRQASLFAGVDLQENLEKCAEKFNADHEDIKAARNSRERSTVRKAASNFT